MQSAGPLFSRLEARAGSPATAAPAAFLPTTRAEMQALGWERCDIVIVTGDAYVDHPSFGMAIIGRVLEAGGFKVGIIAQPDWRSTRDFEALGAPRLFFGVTGGNMDSMVNRYTSDRRVRSDDAYTPGGIGGQRPDRCVIVYSQRLREAFKNIPIVLGGIEASLRRIAHFDYWSEQVRRSVLVDAKADLLVFGNAERQILAIAERLDQGSPIASLTDLRGTAFVRRGIPADWVEIDSTEVDTPGPPAPPLNPYADEAERRGAAVIAAAAVAGAPVTGTPGAGTPATGAPVARKPAPATVVKFYRKVPNAQRAQSVIRLPAFEQVSRDAVLYAHASRILHLESNPGNARALVQRHGTFDVWLNPPPIPLSTADMDAVYELPYARLPHPRYGNAKIPAYHMIRFSVSIQRGCFGGCTFCSITEHEGRIIQSRSEDSVIREIETIRDAVPGFTGVVSDLGGPTANMYRLHCKSEAIESACRRPSCVFPGICPNLDTDHAPLINLYRRARALPGVKKVLIASGVRYDLAVESPEYVRELATHHTGGYLKIAPEAIGDGPLAMMMKPGVGAYDEFKRLFDHYSRAAGKEQYLVPYFIAAHPGTRDQDMLELAVWLKKNGFRADQVQAFLPSPMATATAMYHSGKNPLKRITRASEDVVIPKGIKVRRLHKAFLRYHDPGNWPLLREALKRMGRADLIGNGKQHLIPAYQPVAAAGNAAAARRPPTLPFRTQHSGLPASGTGSKALRRAAAAGVKRRGRS
jgi:uncharacterized radical SAM protein YgiQ